MIDYITMARDFCDQSAQDGWINDLRDTGQKELADDLEEIVTGRQVHDWRVYRLQGYIAQVSLKSGD